MRLVVANQATASKRRVYFHLVGTDGITPATGEAGGQPQISIDNAAWTNTGISVLTAIGNGRYSADLTQAAVATAGEIIETRYKSGNTAECPGDSVQVIGFDIDTTLTIRTNTLQSSIASQSTLDLGASSVSNYYSGAIISIVAGTGAGQGGRVITSYNGTTKVVNVVPVWTVNPDNTSVYVITQGGVNAVTLSSAIISPNITAGGDVGSNVQSVAGNVTAADGLSALGQDYFAGAMVADLDGNVTGKVLGGGGGVITGIGVRAVDGSGNAIAPASTAQTLTPNERNSVADSLLARNIKGGSSTGRIVSEAFAASRNKVAFDVPVVGQFTVYDVDDISPLWVGTYSRGANTLGPLTGVDPN